MNRISLNCLVSWIAIAAIAMMASWGTADDDQHDSSQLGRARAMAQIRGQRTGMGYWIGILGAPLDDVLKSHLKLDAGILVQQVVEDSPAGKAGIKLHDILLRFNGQPVGDVPELAEAIAKNKDKQASVDLLRAGEKISLKITPAKRPAAMAMEMPVPAMTDLKDLQQWLEKVRKGQLGDDPLRMMFVHPGIILPKGTEASGALKPTISMILPDDTEVTVTRDGEKPAQIVVKRGDEKWEVQEDEIDKLPEDVRPIVRGMVLGTTLSINLAESLKLALPEQLRTHRALPRDGDAADGTAAPADTGAGKGMQQVMKQLEQLKRQLREQQKQLEQLQRQRQQSE